MGLCTPGNSARQKFSSSSFYYYFSDYIKSYILLVREVEVVETGGAGCMVRVKPVLNWANVCSPEHTSDTSTNYDSFLN